ncbi:transferase family protein [Aspergillus steynii IBT 23096]|uniref:Transferase family protein n=1 Tax=Aspergillus steynii IBT 23096 TaxID=1392250 RepID=A0A2I2GFH5_9EURO|nr:transferase family protein [Aspergillus steynii IBT 23096]PLB51635.1 transferase family protein [Aspergillus steynii IBT 23096]
MDTTYDHIEDVIGQLPILKSYTHVLLCFPLPEDQRASILESLESAAHTVVSALPFLSGRVINEGAGPQTSGVFKVARFPQQESPDHRFVRIEDRSSACPPYQELLAAHGPSSMLPGYLLGPRKAFPEPYDDSDDAPVLDIQANLINGGLLLDLAAQHNIIDAGGIFQIANLLSTAMRGEPIPQAQIDEANRPRKDIIPLLGPDEPLLDHSDLRPPFVIRTLPPLEAVAPYQWRYLRIPAAAVARIKSMADAHPEDFDASTPFVSTNDALTAFLWQRLITVRLARLNNPSAISRISRAVDFRRTMGLSPAYLGHMVRVTFLRLSFAEITTSSLSRLSSLLRKTVMDVSTPYALRSYVSYIANEPDKASIAYGGGFDPVTDFSCSSIAHVKVPVFGDLGRPELLRRPTYRPLPCSAYAAPMLDGEGVEVLVCLLGWEMEDLRGDELWGECVEYVG